MPGIGLPDAGAEGVGVGLGVGLGLGLGVGHQMSGMHSAGRTDAGAADAAPTINGVHSTHTAAAATALQRDDLFTMPAPHAVDHDG